MRNWRNLSGETLELYSPIGIQLIDEFTGTEPLGRTTAALDRLENGQWRPTTVTATRTATGAITYPALERRADLIGGPRRYRVRIEAEFYSPFYMGFSDGIEIDAYPYNDSNPPHVVTRLPQAVALLPAPNYPFAPHVRVVRGEVVDLVTRDPVASASVALGNLERVLADRQGRFALPVRFAPTAGQIAIDAQDQRTGRAGQYLLTLPDGLAHSHTLTIV
jgi:hypothetical protein